MNDRNYLYTFDVRVKHKDGTETWERKELQATSMVEVSRELSTPLDDLRYVTKVIIR